jgi:hypothetical protein
VNRTVYPTREHARKDVARYIEFHYNTKRLHPTLMLPNPAGSLRRLPKPAANRLTKLIEAIRKTWGSPNRSTDPRIVH